ncbi:MAG TPA: hypothetical protein VKT77_02850 [Chthonomonadaceae bacterium]|nr:hypothetical protein [Chthonomonadaceae bacterium]
MGITNETIARVRAGEIVHLRAPRDFSPLYHLLTCNLEHEIECETPFPQAFHGLFWEEELQPALATLVAQLDASKDHYRLLAQTLIDGGVSAEEGLLDITLDKSLRLCLTGRHKKNYGYQIHRDSWFDLAPDGVNIVLYLTDVPAHGNTQFYTDTFGVDVPHDPTTRRVLDDSDLRRVTAFHCRAGDVLVFSGDHLHSGALCETDRFSVEFRLSRCWEYGRPDQGIEYRGLSEFI